MSLSRPRRRLLALLTLLLSPVLVLSTALVASPAHAQKITPAFFGMHDSDWTTAPGVPVGSANFTTTGTYWPYIETAPGIYDFSRLDAQVAAAEKAGAQPMIVLGQTPRFYSANPLSPDYTDYMPNLAAWRAYVTAVAKRYKTRLDYQVWPEPNIIQNWQGSPAQMAQLTAVASQAIKGAAGKGAKVVSPAVALRLDSQQAWTVNYFKQSVGGKRVHTYLDAIAIDPFPLQKGTPEDSYAIMLSIKKQLARIGVKKPFWNNEINYGVAGGGATTRTRYPMAKQQAYVVRTYALSAAARMQRTYWLGWFASPELAINMADNKGRPLPPAKSYKVVRSWLLNTNFVGCSKSKNGVWMCTAKVGKKEVRRIYWKPTGRATVKTPASTKRVQNQSGGVKKRKGAYNVRVDFRPIMVASRK
ncbi:hypothetical protein [Nocardioides sp. cx-173]|uniref:hypothetical protein n=1 Tax=Nocardioides sp. cx-173 TaxID=2898796 RepID=UPI001E522027|nr:hypothetical protein [Nocardioides sp. cx-173]MCD4523758.1 hypothetical protein [Nocardioides sp. cx-173]UGB41918.1 hypothetical protein LQ940_21550 [Nocardioides sp. cx-173]